MTRKHNEILQFLSKYKSCSQEQLLFFTDCEIQDIDYLVRSNLIVRDEKTNLLYLKMRKLDIRTVIALDVLKIASKYVKECGYSNNFPVIFTITTIDNKIFDIIVIRHIEQETVFKNLNRYSKADKIIIVLEDENYDRNQINSKKEVLICKYPIEVIDKIN